MAPSAGAPKKKKVKDLLLEYVRFSKFKETMELQPAEAQLSALPHEQDLIEKYGGQLKHYPNRAQLFERYFREDCEPTLKNLPVVAISAGGQDAKDRAMKLGVTSYLKKPVRFADVMDTVKQLLRIT